MTSPTSRSFAPLLATSLAAVIAACGGAPSQPAGPAPVVVTAPPAGDGSGSAAAPRVTKPGPNVTPDGVVFNYKGEAQDRIFLAGSFNGWSKDDEQYLMKDDDGDRVWSITVKLAPGTYQYKYVINGTWTQDTNAPADAPDGYGARNSQFDVK